MDPAPDRSPAPGVTLGHYRLIERVGAGGMGEVWRARDERLERDVALKLLLPGTLADEAARKRFRREALSLSQLNHPNIATVFDFNTEAGLDFLVMEYVAGPVVTERLAKGPLPEAEVARLGVQLADGLAAAHAQGIIHRDLKPANVRLTPDGRLKILDFGLAKLVRPTEGRSLTESLTEAQALIGTLAFMAPEQVRGEAVDARSDLWSAGLVLYELATATRAYKEEHSAQVLYAILNQTPAAPRSLNGRVSAGLEAIILKCLEREPGRRYQAATELAADLQRLLGGLTVQAEQARVQARRVRTLSIAVPVAVVAVLALLTALNVGDVRTRLFAPAPIRSIAVLPLANLSGDASQEYFADGMTEALINDLGQVGSLRIISRTSVMQYKQTKKGLKEIARELDVDAVVEGSVARSGERVRISTQLVNARKDRQLWAQSYERELRDVLVMQGEIARAIVAEVRAKVTPEQATRLASAQQVDPEAQEAYLRGRYFITQWTESGARTAIEYFERALSRDPRMAPAYAGLAEGYYMLGAGGLEAIPPREGYEKAREAALKALGIDDNLSNAHMVLAAVYQEYDWEFAKAEKENERAIELNPNNGVALSDYAQLVEYYRRDSPRAIALATRAVEVDPLTPFVHANLVARYYYAGQFDQAEAEARKALATDPNFWVTRWILGDVYAAEGMHPEAIAELKRASDLSSGNTFVRASLGFALAKAGRRAEATAILGDFERLRMQRHVAPYCTMKIYAGLSERDSAFAWAERAFDERSSLIIAMEAASPNLAALRSDPRYRDLMRRMGLPAE